MSTEERPFERAKARRQRAFVLYVPMDKLHVCLLLTSEVRAAVSGDLRTLLRDLTSMIKDFHGPSTSSAHCLILSMLRLLPPCLPPLFHLCWLSKDVRGVSGRENISEYQTQWSSRKWTNAFSSCINYIICIQRTRLWRFANMIYSNHKRALFRPSL